MASKQQIGDRVGASFEERWLKETDSLHQAWCPQIEVNGKLMCIIDKTTKSQCKESPSRDEAIKYAINFRNKLRSDVA